MLSRTSRRSLPILKTAALFFLAFCTGGHLRALDAAAMQSMVIVEGDEGRGSAFVVLMDGKSFLVTNSHVVRGNRNVKFRSLRNAEIPTGPLEIANDVDAVRAEIAKTGTALELEPHVESIKIGDEIVVAGNSEGEGVVREIPGKVVGIGPDRIEVDAGFVPGNSGSPILLKSTGKVIGVATYMKIPRGGGAGARSPMSLNEVRRFGYRLDTVEKWIKPASKDRLFMEGLKLSEMDELISSVFAVLDANAGILSKWGVSGFFNKEKAQQYPAFAALGMAMEGFVRNNASARGDEDRNKNATVFFAKLKGILMDDSRGLNENQFSGFYAVQLKESLARRKDFYAWFDGTTMPAYREAWLASRANSVSANASRFSGPPIDPAKLKLTLTDSIAPNEPPDHCHHVSYPPESEPANLENIYWIIEDPKGEHGGFVMHKTSLRVRTPISGTYRVYVEYRGDKTRVVSNVVEIKFAGVAAGASSPAAPSAIPASAAERAKPLAEFLNGTRWFWYDHKDRMLEFRKDGKVGLDDWTQQGFLAAWEATSPSQVKLTIISGRTDKQTATLDFSNDRSSFTGRDFDPSRTIDRSTRASGDDLKRPTPTILENVKTDAQDLSISGIGFTIANLSDGATAFSNRGYVWKDVPPDLSGRRYTKIAGGAVPQIVVRAKRDFVLDVITTLNEKAGQLSGWEQTNETFGYNDGNHTHMVLLRKKVTAGQELEIPQGNWTGVLVVLPK